MEDHMPPYTGYNWAGGELHHKVPKSLEPASQMLPVPFVVVVTGGSRGIGAATAKAFAQAGASGIVITARKVETLEETKKACLEAAKCKNLRVSTLAANSGADEVPAKAIADIVQREHGRLDLLINNASWIATEESAFEREFENINVSQISGTIDANYVGRFVLMKHLMPALLNSSDGAKTIIDVNSLGSHMIEGSTLGYRVSVFAMHRLMESAANVYGSRGVMFHTVHPGAVLTSPPPGMPDWIVENSIDSPQLLAAVILWLIKEKRSWLNGRYISANWDVEALEARKDEIVEGDKLKFRMVL